MRYVLIVFFVLAAQAALLSVMHRVPFCECGVVRAWGGIHMNPEMSQQFADIYTPSHFLHGILFFWILWALRKKIPMSLPLMLAAAILVEAAWEVIENTDFIINRYRAVTISYDYYGDSIFNSVSDTLFMVFGFFFARFAPWWASVATALLFELGTLYLIRDNLTLNIIMLLYPFDFILRWQSGG